jgi:DNA invertase Pin-like site-specific DNA recombinase
LIVERVKCGLAAARARGKQIGRKKLRNSTLIRQLLKNGLSFRQVAKIAGVSHGSISAEKKDMLRDEAIERKKLEENMKASADQKAEIESSLPPSFPSIATTP